MGCDASSANDQGGSTPKKGGQPNNGRFQSGEIYSELSFDFHGLLAEDAEKFVRDTLKSPPKTVCGKRVRCINFITGRGNHSQDNKPVIKPMVLDLCKKLGFNAQVHPHNEGIIAVVFIPEACFK